MALAGSDVYDRVSRSHYYRSKYPGLTAEQRHLCLLAELNKGSQQVPQPDASAAAAALASTVTDADVLRQHHKFLRTAADDAQDNPADWSVRLAKRYYARLFKEYAIADLSRYKESKVGIRWRTKDEVESGKGQFTCGAVACNETIGLASYEVEFTYLEAGQTKKALVKLRMCAACAAKLNYKREKEYRRLGQVAASLWHQHWGQRDKMTKKNAGIHDSVSKEQQPNKAPMLLKPQQWQQQQQQGCRNRMSHYLGDQERHGKHTTGKYSRLDPGRVAAALQQQGRRGSASRGHEQHKKQQANNYSTARQVAAALLQQKRQQRQQQGHRHSRDDVGVEQQQQLQQDRGCRGSRNDDAEDRLQQPQQGHPDSRGDVAGEREQQQQEQQGHRNSSNAATEEQEQQQQQDNRNSGDDGTEENPREQHEQQQQQQGHRDSRDAVAEEQEQHKKHKTKHQKLQYKSEGKTKHKSKQRHKDRGTHRDEPYHSYDSLSDREDGDGYVAVALHSGQRGTALLDSSNQKRRHAGEQAAIDLKQQQQQAEDEHKELHGAGRDGRWQGSSDRKRLRGDQSYAQQQQQQQQKQEPPVGQHQGCNNPDIHASAGEATAAATAAVARAGSSGQDLPSPAEQQGCDLSDADIEHWLDVLFATA